MVPIAIGLNINWVAIGDRFNLYHVMMYLGIMSVHFWFCFARADIRRVIKVISHVLKIKPVLPVP